MSLTALLQNPLHANLTAWLKHHFPNNTTVVTPPIVVAKEVHSNLDYSRIGTGFDYLFRFQLERINAKFLQAPRKWIAEYGLEMVMKRARRVKPELAIQNQSSVAGLLSVFEEAKRQHDTFISSGVLTTELIRSCLFLANLDVIYRTGRTEFAIRKQASDEEATAEVEHVKKLFYAVNWQPFLARRQCVLNPTFGRAGDLVGGADADIIIDGVLIDLKVTATLSVQRSHLNQLIGYYLLSLIHTKKCKPIYPIHTVAFYFPRADYLLQMPIANYFNKADFQQRKAEFIGLVRDYNLDLINWKNNEYLFNDSSAVKYRVDRHDFKCPYCQADKYSISATGQTSAGRYKYKCKKCDKGFSTVFSEGKSIESVIQLELIKYRMQYEEADCIQKELLRKAELSRNRVALFEKSRAK